MFIIYNNINYLLDIFIFLLNWNDFSSSMGQIGLVLDHFFMQVKQYIWLQQFIIPFTFIISRQMGQYAYSIKLFDKYLLGNKIEKFEAIFYYIK